MKALIALLLIAPPCHARLGVDVALAIARARISVVQGTPEKPTVTKRRLEIFATPNCRHCITAYRELSADPYVITHFEIVKRPAQRGMTRVPHFRVDGGETEFVGYPNTVAVIKWLKTEEGKR